MDALPDLLTLSDVALCYVGAFAAVLTGLLRAWFIEP